MPPEELSNRAKYEPVARAAAKAYGIDESFFVSLLTHENDTWDPLRPSFDKYDNGRPKSIGIGQITEETARALGIDPSKRSDPYTAIPAAAKLVSGLNKKYDGDWWKIYAAYNAGERPVDAAIAKASGNNAVANWGRDWRTYFAQEHPDYQTTIQAASGIIDTALHGGTRGPEIADFTSQARKAAGMGTGTVPRVPQGPPDLNDDRYITQGDNGEYNRDYEQWAKDNLSYYSSQKLKRDLEEGPNADYYNDVIKEISANIASGQYGLSKAKLELDTRKDVWQTVAQNATNLLQWAVPEGTEYYPGTEPGGFYNKMGVQPTKPITSPINLFGEGLDIANRGAELSRGLPQAPAGPVTEAFNNIYPNRPLPVQGPQSNVMNQGQLANTFGGVQFSNPFEQGQNTMQQALPGFTPGQDPKDLFAQALDIFKRGYGG